jgi:hypothetical protein
MKVTLVCKCLLASWNDQHRRHLFKWGNRWNILGFSFTKRDALSSVYKIYMVIIRKIGFYFAVVIMQILN